MHTEKAFRNLIKSTRNQIVFIIFRLILNQADVRLVPKQSENGNYNQISVWFNKISKMILCGYHLQKMILLEYELTNITTEVSYNIRGSDNNTFFVLTLYLNRLYGYCHNFMFLFLFFNF